MKKLLFFPTLGILFLTSCQSEPKYDLKKVEEEVGSKVKPLEEKEKKELKGILEAVFPKGWEVIGLFEVQPSEESFLRKFLVKVYSPYEHVIWNRFVWLTSDGKLLFTKTYLVGDNSVGPIVPKKDREYPLESLRWVLDIERVAFDGNLPISLTKGKRIVYLVWNPYCKTCFQEWKEMLKKAKENEVSVRLIPYHGVYYPMDNLYMLIYLLWKAQNEGLYAVLDGYYSSAKSFEDFLSRLKEETFQNLNGIPEKTFNNIGFQLKQISKILETAKIFVVPTSVLVEKVEPKLGLAEGYVIVGQITFSLPK